MRKNRVAGEAAGELEVACCGLTLAGHCVAARANYPRQSGTHSPARSPRLRWHLTLGIPTSKGAAQQRGCLPLPRRHQNLPITKQDCHPLRTHLSREQGRGEWRLVWLGVVTRSECLGDKNRLQWLNGICREVAGNVLYCDWHQRKTWINSQLIVHTWPRGLVLPTPEFPMITTSTVRM